MAALCHFPSFSCVSHKLCAVRHPLLKVDEQQLLRWETHRLFTRKEITRLTISASLIKKPRVSKKVKSNVDLCNDLREFVLAVGLPEGHVPSTKELSQHGRKDLANIVRRRGYKKIKELLMNSTEGDTNTEKSSAKNQDAANGCESESTEGHNEEVNKLGDCIFLSSESHVEENHENHLSSTNGVLPFNSGIQSCEAVESPTSLSLHEKAAKFIQYGELDAIEAKSQTTNFRT